MLEYLNRVLEAIIKDRSLLFRESDIKSWMNMLCRGIEYCHRNWCLHRDLKPGNLLVSPSGELKIADFGLARECGDPGARMTSQVVTRWYRAPELLLGSRAYSAAVDMWAVGGIFAELLLRTPYLAGASAPAARASSASRPRTPASTARRSRPRRRRRSTAARASRTSSASSRPSRSARAGACRCAS